MGNIGFLGLEADGKINEDHCAIVKIYEKNMGIEIGR